MGITQTNRFECERCGCVVSKTDEVGHYDDPIVDIFGGDKWDYIDDGGTEKLACPRCAEWWNKHGPGSKKSVERAT